MKYMAFVEKNIDPFLLMQFTDLSRSLAKQMNLEVEYNYLSYYDPLDVILYISRFWDPFAEEKRVLGLKSDIYVHCIGHAQHTDYDAIRSYHQAAKSFSYPHFAYQLLAVCEEVRLYDQCMAKRPGTKKAIQHRKRTYQAHYKEQIHKHVERQQWADAFLCVLYIELTKEGSYAFPQLPDILEHLVQTFQDDLMHVYEVKSTLELVQLCIKLWPKLEQLLTRDSTTDYFMLYTPHVGKASLTDRFDEMTRKERLKNQDQLHPDSKEEDEAHQDKLPSWHRETSQPTQSFLQFELESGTKIHLLGASAREMESGDQAMGSVQASSKASSGKDFSEQELEQSKNELGDGANGQSLSYRYGETNRHAVLVSKAPRQPASAETRQYETYYQIIRPWQRSLQRTIEKTLEHKNHWPQKGLHAGKLSKNLLPLWTDDQPRIFYKKQQPSQQIDACFSLLVDCSSSMVNKMEQTKKGIILFHEALKALQIRHTVHGFWEDANQATAAYQPNILQEIISYQYSLSPQSGRNIMQLQPEEDNRDGFIIRHMTDALKNRTEKHKILLVFTDGEPAASNYDDSGIRDTYQAVHEARKQGITVIGVFLSTEEIQEQEKNAMKNIYGKHHILVNNVEQLPEYVAPLLKQLILKQII